MVEKKDLISVADVQYGYPFESSLFTEDENFIPLIRIRDVKPGLPSTYYSGEYSSEFIIRKGDILVGMDGEFNLAKWKSRDGLLNQRVLKLSGKNNICNSGYLYHYMGPVFKKIELQTAGGSVKHLSAKVINKIQIPIPPLSEQNRIVGILDTFTESIENLKKQITERKKQYAYLIDEAFGGSLAEMKNKAEVGIICIETLSSHGTFTRGRRFVRTDIIDNGQPCIHYGDMYTYYGLCADKAKTHLPYDFPKKMRYAKKGDVVIVAAGENNEDIGVGLVWQGEEPAAVHDACFIYESDFEPMFLSYFLRSSIYHLQIKSNVVRGKICSISSDGIGKALIPIYPIDKQKEIVENLYPYERLFVNLQAQLSLRQKQYEYYRNKLLSFE